MGGAQVDDSDPSGMNVLNIYSRCLSIIILLSEKARTSSESPYKKCGICMDPFQLTHSPISASRSANSSARLPFGLPLPCPNSHSYCLECIASYITSKLDLNGAEGNFGATVFPIRCPECDANEWPDGIPDDVAVKVLDGKAMDLWVRI